MRTKSGKRMGMIEVFTNTCKHFTGTKNAACGKEVAYRKGLYIPCFRNSNYSDGECEFAEFPTEEEAQAEVEQIRRREKAIGDGICPDCGSKLASTIANGHGTISCLSCRDRKSTRLNSSHIPLSRMPSSA